MLRIWGGGLYERDIFYRLCDEKGILVWHDFMFACSTYPDHRQWFREEMRREFDYQTKRLRSHCCLGLFCGTNEVHWLFNSTDNPKWGIEFTYEHQYGMYVANILSKEIIHANCPFIPYWNSSHMEENFQMTIRWGYPSLAAGIHEQKDGRAYRGKRLRQDQSKICQRIRLCRPLLYGNDPGVHGRAALCRTSEVWQMHNNVFEKTL